MARFMRAIQFYAIQKLDGPDKPGHDGRGLYFFQCHEAVRQPFRADMIQACHFTPSGSVETEDRITLEILMHFGQLDPIRTGQRRTINFPAADHENLAALIQGLSRQGVALDVRGVPVAPAGGR